jgi:hypothetical protein
MPPPLGAVLTPAWLDEVFTIFSHPTSADAPFLACDRSLVDEVLLSLEPDSALPHILGFSDCLSIDCRTAAFSELSRKLAALTYFAPSGFLTRPDAFIDEFFELLASFKTVKPPAYALAHGFAVLSPCVLVLHRQDPEFRILTIGLDLYLSQTTLSDAVISEFFGFFVESLFKFPMRERPRADQFVTFKRLLAVVGTALLGIIDAKFDLVALGASVLDLMASDRLPLDVRNEFWPILTTLTLKGHTISLDDPDAGIADSVVQIIVDNLKSIPFHSASRHEKISPVLSTTALPDGISEQEFDDVTFIGPLFQDEIVNSVSDDQNLWLRIPTSIANVREVTSLISNISKFCRAVALHPRRKMNVFLLSRLVVHGSVRGLEIFPFFIAVWVHHFIRNATVHDVDSLHDVGFFRIILEESYLGDDDAELKEFCSSLIVAIARTYAPQGLLSDLFEFFARAIRCCYLSATLSSCVRRCAFVSLGAFVRAATSFRFAEKFASAMLKLQHYASIGGSALETFRVGLLFIDSLRSNTQLLKFFFERQEFGYLVMHLFFDSSTVPFASELITAILVQGLARRCSLCLSSP